MTRKTKQLYQALKGGCCDLVLEDYDQFISLMALDQFREPEKACLAMAELSYLDALKLAAWLVARAEVGLQRNARESGKSERAA